MVKVSNDLITIDKIKEAISSIYDYKSPLKFTEHEKPLLTVILFEVLTQWINRDLETQEKQTFTSKIMELVYLKGSRQHAIDQIGIRTALGKEKSEWLFNHVTEYLYNKQEK